MIKKVSFALIFICFCFIAVSQTVEEIYSQTDLYIWGEGRGKTLEEAESTAVMMLMRRFTGQMEQNLRQVFDDSHRTDGAEQATIIQKIINTYRDDCISKSQEIIVSEDQPVRVLRYIKKKDLDKVFENRQLHIFSYVEKAQKAVENAQISDALRYYYWAMTLLKSHPNAGNIAYEGPDGSGTRMMVFLRTQITEILEGVNLELSEIKTFPDFKIGLINITYNGKPVKNYDYKYWTGLEWKGPISAKEGLGYIKLPGTMDDFENVEIQIKTEYIFEHRAPAVTAIKELLEIFDPVIFRPAYKHLSLEVKGKTTRSEGPEKGLDLPDAKVRNTRAYESAIEAFVEATNSRKYSNAHSLFKSEANKIYRELIQQRLGLILCYDNIDFFEFDDKIVARSLKIVIINKDDETESIENLIVIFDPKDRKISGLTLGLDNKQAQEIVDQQYLKEEVRIFLLDFIEDFRTAFVLRQVDYVESVLGFNPVIIKNRNAETKTGLRNPFENNPVFIDNIKYKEEYITKIQRIYENAQNPGLNYMHIDFQRPGRDGKLLGIRLYKDFYYPKTGGTGHLFFLFNIEDASQPILLLSTWQPEVFDERRLIGIENFR